jgi:hypothetical protein
LTEADEQAAQRIAERGRDAVVARLRPVFAEAATSHAHLVLVPLGPDDLERMVQAAADRADGALWRRALADVAIDELRISLAEAVKHPAVRRAHELVGAPPYGPGQAPATPASASPTRDPPKTAPPKTAPPEEVPPEEVPPPSVPEALRVAATHLGGIDGVRDGARNLELRFTEVGLDVVDTSGGEPIGRLTWDDITEIELPRQRRSLRQRRKQPPLLVVRTDRGEAHFELPGLTDEQVDEHLAPMRARARGVQSSD